MMRTLFVCLSICLVAEIARADDDDPPSRVGRLSALRGNVSFKPAALADDDWVAASPNRPVTIGDAIWVDDGGRALLHVGATTVAIDESTSVRVLALDEDVVQLGVARGRVMVHVRDLDGDDAVEIDLPAAAARLRRPGAYVLSFDEGRDDTRIGVRRGSVDVTSNGHTFDVDDGQVVTLEGRDDVTYDVDRLGAPDGFEGWAIDRDRAAEQAASLRYVSRDMTGYEDLDQYGAWTQTPDYGAIWYPSNVSAGWVPYRSGHWAWVAPWGWTWVDDMPWGFAPFHYGRWVSTGGRWGWCPGEIVRRPVYAPALVAWVGVGGPSLGWFPLGPREVYVPSYRVTPRYVQRVNVTHVHLGLGPIDVSTLRYVNRGPAFTAVPHEVFVNARPVAQAYSAHGIAPNAPIVTRVALEPRRASYAPPPVRYRPPAQVFARPVMTVRQPARPAPAVYGGSAAPAPRVAPVRSAITSSQTAPPRPVRADLPPMRPVGAAQAQRPGWQDRQDHGRAPPRQAEPNPPPRSAPAPFVPPRQAEPTPPRQAPMPSAPPQRAAPAPRYDPAPAPAPRYNPAPAPAPRYNPAPPRSAPAPAPHYNPAPPRSAPAPAPRGAPAPQPQPQRSAPPRR